MELAEVLRIALFVVGTLLVYMLAAAGREFYASKRKNVERRQADFEYNMMELVVIIVCLLVILFTGVN